MNSCDKGPDMKEYVGKNQMFKELGVINVTINEHEKLNIERSFSASYEFAESFISDRSEESTLIYVSLQSFDSKTYLHMGISKSYNTFFLKQMSFTHHELTDQKRFSYSGEYYNYPDSDSNQGRLISFKVDKFDKNAGKISGNGIVTMLDDNPLLNDTIEYTVNFNFDLTLRESI